MHIGASHAFATDENDRLYGWGDDTKGQLALSADESYATFPKVIPYFADKKIKYCDGGDTHSVAIDYDGHIYTFGDNSSSQLGRTTGDSSPQEIDYPEFHDGEKFTEVHTNMDAVYALTNKGNLYVWGDCENAACPGFTNSTIAKPARINLGFTVDNFFVGIYSIFVVDAEGKVYGFGDNRHGKLCMDKSTKFVDTPTLIENIVRPRNI